MNKSAVKSLKSSFTILFGFQLVLIIVLGILIETLYRNQLKLATARDSYFNSYLLADELRQSSDDLTRMARSYVATGKEKFERAYWEILDIREGKIERPVDYNRIYWDFVMATGQRPAGSGDKISLEDLMIKEGFTASELEKLTLAENNSNDLVKTERMAMNAVKGLFDDGSGNFTIQKEPDRDFAIGLMYGDDYYKIKASIMRPIDDFFKMFQAREEQTVSKYLQLSNILFWISLLLSGLIIIIFIFSFVIIRHQITERDDVERELNDLHKSLEEKIKARTLELEHSKIKLNKALKESENMNRLMVGRELMMIKLKKQIKNSDTLDIKDEYENKK